MQTQNLAPSQYTRVDPPPYIPVWWSPPQFPPLKTYPLKISSSDDEINQWKYLFSDEHDERANEVGIIMKSQKAWRVFFFFFLTQLHSHSLSLFSFLFFLLLRRGAITHNSWPFVKNDLVVKTFRCGVFWYQDLKYIWYNDMSQRERIFFDFFLIYIFFPFLVFASFSVAVVFKQFSRSSLSFVNVWINICPPKVFYCHTFFLFFFKCKLN